MFSFTAEFWFEDTKVSMVLEQCLQDESEARKVAEHIKTRLGADSVHVTPWEN